MSLILKGKTMMGTLPQDVYLNYIVLFLIY